MVARIKASLEETLWGLKLLGPECELNHVLIQKYRNGEDYISEHSDKTVDIVRGTSIVK